jgi:N-acetylglucosaminyldiphosphoundecaprenol N-acetyl-beta-D-mannosaminyltransferase
LASLIAWFSTVELKVLGIRINVVTLDDAILCISRWIDRRERGHCVTLTNVHMVVEARKNAEFRQVMRDASLCLPDGMPLVWIGRARGHAVDRISGPDFMIDFCARTAGQGYRHFFYGGAPSVAEELARTLQARFPGFVVAGSYSPPFREMTPEEDAQVVDLINATKPDVIWVGLGCPKQERWMHANRNQLNASVLLGVGQAFNIHTGHLTRAPQWMRDHGLEWLFRLMVEPRRLWKRYLVTNTSFMAWFFMETLGLKRFE